MDLIARVCALIPPPRFHMVRYHGVLSSHAKVRSEVVPKREEAAAVQLALFEKDTGVLEFSLSSLPGNRGPGSFAMSSTST